MNYIIIIIFGVALFPGFLPNINLGIVYLSVLRAGILFLPLCYWFKNKEQRCMRYYISKDNVICIVTMLIWFIYSLITSIWAKDISSWIHMEYFLGLGVWCTIFFDMANLADNDYIKIFYMTQTILAIHHLIGWYEIITHNYFFAIEEKVNYMEQYNSFAPISMFYNLNDYALVITCGAFISLFCFKVSEYKMVKYFSFVMFISAILLVLVGESRGCLLALILGCGVYVVINSTKEQKRMCILLGVMLICVFSLFNFSALEKLYQELTSILKFDFSHGMNSEMIRVNLIRNGLVFLEKTFGFGIGTGNIEFWMANFLTYYTRGYVNMHNWWMEILTNFGILIFIMYVNMYIYMIIRFYRNVKNSKNMISREISLVFLCWLVAYVIGSVSSSNNFNVEWLWIFWALAIAYLGVPEKEWTGRQV